MEKPPASLLAGGSVFSEEIQEAEYFARQTGFTCPEHIQLVPKPSILRTTLELAQSVSLTPLNDDERKIVDGIA
jgi:hypothetical protein